MIVEEVLQDIGVLDFGNRMSSMCNVALWRGRGDHSPLIGEFAFQLKFRRREELTDEALGRCEAFFLALQAEARDWIQLGATKTGVVYRLRATRRTPTNERILRGRAALPGRISTEEPWPGIRTAPART